MSKLQYLKDVVTLEFDAEKCIGCRKCEEVCPHGVFVVSAGKAHMTDRDDCMECGACQNNCPTGAIAVETGVGCAQGVINGFLRGTEPDCDCSKSCCA